MLKRDYYEVLGINRNADEAAIKRAYRSLAMKYHPDRNPGDRQAIEKMKEINEAYAVLSDREKRYLYDTYGHAGLEGYTTADIYRGTDFASLFREFGLSDFDFGFGNSIFNTIFGTTHSTKTLRKGADIRYDLEVTLEEVAYGAEKKIEILKTRTCNLCLGNGASEHGLMVCEYCNGTGQIVFERRSGYSIFRQIKVCSKCHGKGNIVAEPCPACQGKGIMKEKKEISVCVPQGADTGYTMVIRGEGEAGETGIEPGDLYIVLQVKEHPCFERQGCDIHTTKEITFVQAALGAEVEVQGLYGNVKLKIPEGTQTGSTFRVANEGIPHLNGHNKGDLYVTVKVITPKNLSQQEKQLLQEFDKLQKSRK